MKLPQFNLLEHFRKNNYKNVNVFASLLQNRIETPNATKPTVLHENKLTSQPAVVDEAHENKRAKTTVTKTVSTTTTFSVKKTTNSSSLSQRVYEFEKTARYMIKKLIETRERIEQDADNCDTIEHLKMSIAPDAATLISQGDTLVLETHGSASSELSNAVMKIQSILREKFREVQHARCVKPKIFDSKFSIFIYISFFFFSV